ncbi:MAG: SUMF1/EgtB/PvdO family nonheme iron enzyme [Gammaproteobacteria bacterium]|nr:SUMF1/EgtB/PvdO family nonheme iron enzyme [Gammaproteobacteria bacterium]
MIAGERFLHDLHRLVERLRHAGYRAGLGDLRAIEQLILGLDGCLPEIERLRGMLGAVLCRSEREQKNFPEHFDAWLAEGAGRKLWPESGKGDGHDVSEEAASYIPSSPPVSSIPPRPSTSPRPSTPPHPSTSPHPSYPRTRVSILLLLLALAAGLLACYNGLLPCPREGTPKQIEPSSSVKPPEITPPEITPPEVTPPKVTPPKVMPPEKTSPEVTPPEVTPPEVTPPEKTSPEKTSPEVTPPEVTLPEKTPPEKTLPQEMPRDKKSLEEPPQAKNLWHAWLPWVIFPLLPLILWLGMQRLARLYLRRRLSVAPPDLKKLNVDAATHGLFQSAALAGLAQQLRRHQAEESSRLDLPATVKKTVRNIGWFTSVSAREQRRPEYLALIDRASLADQQTRLINALLDRLEAEDVILSRWYFEGDPRYCYPAPDAWTSHTLAELGARYPGRRLLLFSPGHGLIDPLDGRPAAWLAQFSPWPQRVLFSLEPPGQWKYLQKLLDREDLLVAPAGETGLAAFLERLQTGSWQHRDKNAPPFPPLLAHDAEIFLERRPPPPAEIDLLLRQLRDFLDPDGCAWLAACAVYPELHWQLTLRLGEGLNVFDENRLARLTVLPWLRRNFLPDWLRAALIKKLTVPQRWRTRQILREVLESAAAPDQTKNLALEVSEQRAPRGSSTGIFVDFFAGRLATPVPEALRGARLLPRRALRGFFLLFFLLALAASLDYRGLRDFYSNWLTDIWPPKVEKPEIKPISGEISFRILPPEAEQRVRLRFLEADGKAGRAALSYRACVESPVSQGKAKNACRVRLLTGDWRLVAESPGYQTATRSVRVEAGVFFALGDWEMKPEERDPVAQYRLTVKPDPPEAKVSLPEYSQPYRPDMRLPQGVYAVEVSFPGYKTKRLNVLLDQDTVREMALDREVPPLKFPSFRDPFKDGSGQGPEMIQLPGGIFRMGDIQGESIWDDEKPVHQVTLSRFAIGKYEVTFEEYDRFAKAAGRQKPGDRGWGRGRRPVINVSWEDAAAYAKWLSKQTDQTYRLPTEAEWEYAARASSDTTYWQGNEMGSNRANYQNSDSKDSFDYTAPVGSFDSNAFGLYDTMGNVLEWTGDWYDERYYATSPKTNPLGPDTGSSRVVRGGSWGNIARNCRSAVRSRGSPGSRNGYLGFRLARLTLGPSYPFILGQESPPLPGVSADIRQDGEAAADTSSPAQVSFTVQRKPAEARVRIMNIGPKYRDGIVLKPDRYDIEVSHPGYVTWRQWMEISENTVLPVELETVRYRLTIKPQPSEAKVIVWNISEPYRAEIPLPQGNYQVEISHSGFKTKRLAVELNEDTLREAALKPEDTAAPAGTSPPKFPSFRDPFKDGSARGPEMIKLPGGTFRMGNIQGENTQWNDERPVHQVTLNAFAIGKYEVTFEEYDRFAEAVNRRKPKPEDKSWGPASAAYTGTGTPVNRPKPEDKGWGRGRRPVIHVRWEDAAAYAKWLSEQTGQTYRLPTEAEWEYAARAGSETKYWWGNDIGNNRANCDNSDSKDIFEITAPVGSFPPNAFGLYDTAGNVFEWTRDWHDEIYYARSPEKNPMGPETGSGRVGRGGSWDSAMACRSAYRHWLDPARGWSNLGFRLARLTLGPSYPFTPGQPPSPDISADVLQNGEQAAETPPVQVSFTVQRKPAEARVRIMNIRPKYRDGILLKPDRYDIEVSYPGYVTWRQWRKVSEDTVLPVELEAVRYRLTIKPLPPEAEVRLPDYVEPYRPEIPLPQGTYRVEVNHSGFKTKRLAVELNEDTVREVALEPKEPVAPAVMSSTKFPSFRDPFKDGSARGPEMIKLPGGTFRMGDIQSGDDGDEKPVHKVTLSAFAMGKYEVTFEEYDRFAEATGRKKPDDRGWGRGKRPVINVSWKDAAAYAKWLSEQTGQTYRMPTEAEWEYAARAGSETKYWWGNEIGNNRANCTNSGCKDPFKNTAPVGSFAPNSFGLHDTMGNVYEWVQDRYDSGYYAKSPKRNPTGPETGAYRVIRNGSWSNSPRDVRAAGRDWHYPGYRDVYLGFRLARLTLGPSYPFTPGQESPPPQGGSTEPLQGEEKASEMVLIRGGTFKMGDIQGNGDSDEKPVHEVTLNDFYIGDKWGQSQLKINMVII